MLIIIGHRFASKIKSKGVYSREINVRNISSTLNKRIVRMLERCYLADHIVFVTHEDQGYEYMAVDDVMYNLHDYSEMEDALNSRFGSRCHVVKFNEVNNAKKLLSLIL